MRSQCTRLFGACIAVVLQLPSGCTSLHIADAGGQIRHYGLFVRRDEPLAVGGRTTVWSFGASWWWLHDVRGLALGLSWRSVERPLVVELSSGRELQHAVERALEQPPTPLLRESPSWACLLHDDAEPHVAHTRVGSLGLAGFWQPPGGRVVALYGETSRLGPLGTTWNTVALRRDLAGARADSSQAWILLPALSPGAQPTR